MSNLNFNNHISQLENNLYYFAINLTGNEDDAKDLKQETIYKALVNKDKFTNPANLKAWMFTIMKNTFINDYRRKVKSNTIFDNTKDEYFINSSVEKTDSSPELDFSEQEILAIIDNLQDSYRIPFTMYIQGYKYKEIAEILDLNIGTVKSRIFFTRKKIIKQMSFIAN